MATIIDKSDQNPEAPVFQEDNSKRNLWLRRLGILLGVALIGVGYYFFTQMGANKAAPEKVERKEQLRTVAVAPARVADIPAYIDVQGRLQAFDKVQIYTEVGGKFERSAKSFKVGNYYPKGSVLAEIDDTEPRLVLLSAKAGLQNAITAIMPDLKIDYPQSFPRWEVYLRDFDVNQSLRPFPTPANEQERNFIASRNLLTTFYTIQSQEERLRKYTVYAPFGGELTIANTNVGAVVSPGQPLGTLMNTSSYELAATVPLSDLDYLQPGRSVELRSEDTQRTWNGKVRRISNQVDPTSQTVTVFIGVSGRELREGMYLKGRVAGPALENVTRIARDQLVDQNQVYLVRDSALTLRPVEVVTYQGDNVLVRGLEENAPLLDSKVSGAYDGMRVAPQAEAVAPTDRVEASL